MSEVEECEKNLFHVVLQRPCKHKLSEHSNLVKIFHVRDIENLMGTDNLEEFLKRIQLNCYIFYCC